MQKAVILLSGGLDSATVLAIAKAAGFECYTMSFDYGQRHRSELNASLKISLALGFAEVLSAQDIFIGVNAVDYSGYPDCRPAFIEAFEKLANLATKAGVEGKSFHIQAPLQNWSKAKIIQQGVQLGVNYALTVSCYQADEEGRACGRCDSCRLRAAGFKQAGIADPTPYYTK